MPDGALSVCMGRIGSDDRPMVFAGGNCSIQGLALFLDFLYSQFFFLSSAYTHASWGSLVRCILSSRNKWVLNEIDPRFPPLPKI